MGSILKTVLVTGCSGLVGTYVSHILVQKGYRVIGIDIKFSKFLPTEELFHFENIDIRNTDKINILFEHYKFDSVINSFGIKGSPIMAKEKPLAFLEPSIKGNINIIENSHKHNCWLVFMSSVGVYEPAEEFVEDTVWKTLPSPNDWFPSWSKRIPELYLEAHKVQHGYDRWTIVRPANIFGEYDNFGEGATVIGATCRKVYDAIDEIEAWGDGTPTRDFIYADDVAESCVKCFENEIHDVVNLGSGEEITIKRMIETVAKVSGKDIKINWDTSKPNGDMKRRMSTKKQMELGLRTKHGFEEGIKRTYNHYKEINDEKNR